MSAYLNGEGVQEFLTPPIMVGQTAPTRFCCILGMGFHVSSLLMLKANTNFGRSRISLLWGHVLKFYLAELIS